MEFGFGFANLKKLSKLGLFFVHMVLFRKYFTFQTILCIHRNYFLLITKQLSVIMCFVAFAFFESFLLFWVGGKSQGVIFCHLSKYGKHMYMLAITQSMQGLLFFFTFLFPF